MTWGGGGGGLSGGGGGGLSGGGEVVKVGGGGWFKWGGGGVVKLGGGLGWGDVGGITTFWPPLEERFLSSFAESCKK